MILDHKLQRMLNDSKIAQLNSERPLHQTAVPNKTEFFFTKSKKTVSEHTAVWCKGLSELSCPILESFNILCNLWSKIIHLIKSGLHTDIVVESI